MRIEKPYHIDFVKPCYGFTTAASRSMKSAAFHENQYDHSESIGLRSDRKKQIRKKSTRKNEEKRNDRPAGEAGFGSRGAAGWFAGSLFPLGRSPLCATAL